MKNSSKTYFHRFTGVVPTNNSTSDESDAPRNVGAIRLARLMEHMKQENTSYIEHHANSMLDAVRRTRINTAPRLEELDAQEHPFIRELFPDVALTREDDSLIWRVQGVMANPRRHMALERLNGRSVHQFKLPADANLYQTNAEEVAKRITQDETYRLRRDATTSPQREQRLLFPSRVFNSYIGTVPYSFKSGVRVLPPLYVAGSMAHWPEWDIRRLAFNHSGVRGERRAVKLLLSNLIRSGRLDIAKQVTAAGFGPRMGAYDLALDRNELRDPATVAPYDLAFFNLLVNFIIDYLGCEADFEYLPESTSRHYFDDDPMVYWPEVIDAAITVLKNIETQITDLHLAPWCDGKDEDLIRYSLMWHLRYVLHRYHVNVKGNGAPKCVALAEDLLNKLPLNILTVGTYYETL